MRKLEILFGKTQEGLVGRGGEESFPSMASSGDAPWAPGAGLRGALGPRPQREWSPAAACSCRRVDPSAGEVTFPVGPLGPQRWWASGPRTPARPHRPLPGWPHRHRRGQTRDKGPAVWSPPRLSEYPLHRSTRPATPAARGTRPARHQDPRAGPCARGTAGKHHPPGRGRTPRSPPGVSGTQGPAASCGTRSFHWEVLMRE